MHVEAISARYQRTFEPRCVRQIAVVDMNTTNLNSLSFTRDSIQAVFPTNVAAAALNRKPQTLRKWACLENGPIRPVRINGRLAWRVADIRALLTWGGSKSEYANTKDQAARAIKPGPVLEAQADKQPLNVVFADELPNAYEAPDELTQRLLTVGGGNLLCGDSNSTKTFFAIALAAAVALGNGGAV